MTPRALMAELFGKATGLLAGASAARCTCSTRSTTCSAATASSAGTSRWRPASPSRASTASDGRVTLCFFGEGAVSIGGFHEGLSLAALWKLPIVFICENNEYSMGTPLSRSMSVEDVSLKALGYGMDRDRFFADDVLEVERRIGEAVKRAREQSLPTLVEVRTYRFRGHSMSDPAKYRTPGGARGAQEARPAAPRARRCSSSRACGDARLEALEKSVEAEVADAVRFADESPEPTLAELEPTTYSGPFAY